MLLALALHAAVLAIALQIARPAPPLVIADPQYPPLHFYPIALAPKVVRHGPRHGPPAAVQIAEREIIDQGHGVTMTIQGGSSVDAGVPEAPHASERWLSAEVWVPMGPTRAPEPSPYCAPKEPEMPEIAVERSITGRVEVTYVVDSDGVVSGVTQEGDAPLVLSRAVRGWLQGCLFEPALEAGRRVPARVRQTFVFKIR